jgi:hypothetical protein
MVVGAARAFYLHGEYSNELLKAREVLKSLTDELITNNSESPAIDITSYLAGNRNTYTDLLNDIDTQIEAIKITQTDGNILSGIQDTRLVELEALKLKLRDEDGLKYEQALKSNDKESQEYLSQNTTPLLKLIGDMWESKANDKGSNPIFKQVKRDTVKKVIMDIQHLEDSIFFLSKDLKSFTSEKEQKILIDYLYNIRTELDLNANKKIEESKKIEDRKKEDIDKAKVAAKNTPPKTPSEILATVQSPKNDTKPKDDVSNKDNHINIGGTNYSIIDDKVEFEENGTVREIPVTNTQLTAVLDDIKRREIKELSDLPKDDSIPVSINNSFDKVNSLQKLLDRGVPIEKVNLISEYIDKLQDLYDKNVRNIGKTIYEDGSIFKVRLEDSLQKYNSTIEYEETTYDVIKNKLFKTYTEILNLAISNITKSITPQSNPLSSLKELESKIKFTPFQQSILDLFPDYSKVKVTIENDKGGLGYVGDFKEREDSINNTGRISTTIKYTGIPSAEIFIHELLHYFTIPALINYTTAQKGSNIEIYVKSLSNLYQKAKSLGYTAVNGTSVHENLNEFAVNLTNGKSVEQLKKLGLYDEYLNILKTYLQSITPQSNSNVSESIENKINNLESLVDSIYKELPDYVVEGMSNGITSDSVTLNNKARLKDTILTIVKDNGASGLANMKDALSRFLFDSKNQKIVDKILTIGSKSIQTTSNNIQTQIDELNKKREEELKSLQIGEILDRYDSVGNFQDEVEVVRFNENGIRFKDLDTSNETNINVNRLNSDYKLKNNVSYRKKNFDKINEIYDAEIAKLKSQDTTQTKDQVDQTWLEKLNFSISLKKSFADEVIDTTIKGNITKIFKLNDTIAIDVSGLTEEVKNRVEKLFREYAGETGFLQGKVKCNFIKYGNTYILHKPNTLNFIKNTSLENNTNETTKVEPVVEPSLITFLNNYTPETTTIASTNTDTPLTIEVTDEEIDSFLGEGDYFTEDASLYETYNRLSQEDVQSFFMKDLKDMVEIFKNATDDEWDSKISELDTQIKESVKRYLTNKKQPSVVPKIDNSKKRIEIKEKYNKETKQIKEAFQSSDENQLSNVVAQMTANNQDDNYIKLAKLTEELGEVTVECS